MRLMRAKRLSQASGVVAMAALLLGPSLVGEWVVDVPLARLPGGSSKSHHGDDAAGDRESGNEGECRVESVQA